MGILNKNYLGIDIGSSAVKLVELKREKGRLRLLTYGFAEINEKTDAKKWQEDPFFMAGVINNLRAKAETESNSAVSALPSFAVFSSIINLSNINKKELPSAIQWEAKKVIPMSLEDMVLDWKIIEGEEKNSESVRVLLTGAPKKLVQKYTDIFKEAKISLLSLETETFSLVRSLMGSDKSTVMIVEIGSRSSDIFIVANGIPVLNRSIDLGGENITEMIAKNLNVGVERAEQFKFDISFESMESETGVIPKAVLNTLNPAINEIKYMLNLYQNKNQEKVEKIILSGGSSLLPNLDGYLSRILDVNVVIGDPWARVSYPLELEPLLKEIGPKMSVAIGLAMREME